jgi:hypothetical protein
MLSRQVQSVRRLKKLNFNTISIKSISNRDVIGSNQIYSNKPKYDLETQPEKFQKEFLNNNHWLANYTDKLFLWYRAPFNLRIWTGQKDTELGRFTWNTNALKNTLSNILFRSERLQNRWLMNFMVKNFDHRFTMSANKVEEPPKISTNSVFLYRDSTYSVVNRRSIERFAFLMILSMAWNPSTLAMYAFLGFYFQILNRNYYSSLCTSFRMDLLPATEQIHIVKIGPMGFPRSVLVNIKDLIKIEKNEENIRKSYRLNLSFIFMIRP